MKNESKLPQQKLLNAAVKLKNERISMRRRMDLLPTTVWLWANEMCWKHANAGAVTGSLTAGGLIHTNKHMHEKPELSDWWLMSGTGGPRSRWALTHACVPTHTHTATATQPAQAAHTRMCRRTYHRWVHGAGWEFVRFANLWETE